MEKEYTFEFYGTKQQLLNKISSNILDNNFSNPKTFYIGEYMIYVTSDKIEFGIQRGGHSGGYWYIPAIEEFEDHLVLSGKIRYIGPEDNRSKASKVISEIFFVLFIIFLAYPFIIVMRIKNEEEVLERELQGYKEYKIKVKYRLIPFVW